MSLSTRNSYMWKINIVEPLYLTYLKNTFGVLVPCVCLFVCLFTSLFAMNAF